MKIKTIGNSHTLHIAMWGTAKRLPSRLEVQQVNGALEVNICTGEVKCVASKQPGNSIMLTERWQDISIINGMKCGLNIAT